jgi:alpha-tubulin suppressor-like RCC1 family protein
LFSIYYRLGHNSERNAHTPQLVETMVGKRPKQASCGGFHTAVLTEDGHLYTFGGGEHGQLGVRITHSWRRHLSLSSFPSSSLFPYSFFPF